MKPIWQYINNSMPTYCVTPSALTDYRATGLAVLPTSASP